MRKYLILALACLVVVQVCAVICKPKVTVRATNLSEDIQGGTIVQETSTIEEMSVSAKTFTVEGLELVGTAMGNPKDPIAFIKDTRTGRQGIYKKGSLVEGSRVVLIAKGSVDLEKDGQVATLFLKRGSDFAKNEIDSQSMITGSGNEFVMNRSALLKETTMVLNTVRQMRVAPYSQQNKVIGMRVEGVKEGTIISQAGIKDRDVVTMVNNQKIDSYQKALQVFSKVRNQDQIMVCVLRSGKMQQLNYRMAN
jgi:general secretion pathway protein C